MVGIKDKKGVRQVFLSALEKWINIEQVILTNFRKNHSHIK